MQVVLDGIQNMLKLAGQQVDVVATMIEECNGLDRIEQLQGHENVDIYKLAYDIIEQYFSDEVSFRNSVITHRLRNTLGCVTNWMLFFFSHFQTEDVNLAPPMNDTSFEFDPSANIPNDGFKF